MSATGDSGQSAAPRSAPQPPDLPGPPRAGKMVLEIREGQFLLKKITEVPEVINAFGSLSLH